MEFIESTHAKSTWTLVGGPTFSNIFTNIDFKDDCLVFNWFWFLLEKCLNLFYICYWANLASHKGATSLLSRYSSSHFLRIPWTHVLLMTISIHDVIFGCLDICLICLNKTHVVCYTSILTLMFYDSAWRAVQVRTLTLFFVIWSCLACKYFETT